MTTWTTVYNFIITICFCVNYCAVSVPSELLDNLISSWQYCCCCCGHHRSPTSLGPRNSNTFLACDRTVAGPVIYNVGEREQNRAERRRSIVLPVRSTWGRTVYGLDAVLGRWLESTWLDDENVNRTSGLLLQWVKRFQRRPTGEHRKKHRSNNLHVYGSQLMPQPDDSLRVITSTTVLRTLRQYCVSQTVARQVLAWLLLKF